MEELLSCPFPTSCPGGGRATPPQGPPSCRGWRRGAWRSARGCRGAWRLPAHSHHPSPPAPPDTIAAHPALSQPRWGWATLVPTALQGLNSEAPVPWEQHGEEWAAGLQPAGRLAPGGCLRGKRVTQGTLGKWNYFGMHRVLTSSSKYLSSTQTHSCVHLGPCRNWNPR